MPRFWWVNHNQTASQEIGGQYLWSPKVERGGVRSQFYDNMREARPGDLVLSYASQAIRYVGPIAEFAIPSPKPLEFGTTGANWSNDGWYLPVFWTPLGSPVRPKEIITDLRDLLPTKYSPLNARSGGGNQKAYLAEIAPEVFDLVTAEASFDRAALAQGGANSLTFNIVTENLEDGVEQWVQSDITLTDTERRSVIQARRGQGKFRSNVEAVEQACRLTGVTNPTLLIASHIKPWRVCATAQERLDGMNGLLLTPDADLLFDRGFISFKDDGEALVSSRVEKADLRRLGFDQLAAERFGFEEAPAVWRTESFAARQQGYLAYHRAQVFIS